MMKNFLKTCRHGAIGLGALALVALVAGCVGVQAPAATAPTKAANTAPIKVVYHVSENLEQAANALRNARNQISVDPTVKIAMVTHAGGVDFLLDGAKDKNNALFAPTVEELKRMGVEFKVCQITLQRRNIDPKRVIDEATMVPSGVAEVSRLQAREGYVYVKP